MMTNKPLEQWIKEYGESHQNRTNQKIHTVCVPVIFGTIVAFLYLLNFDSFPIGFTLSGLALIFYFRLKWTVGMGMSVAISVSFGLCYFIQKWTGLLLEISIGLFVIAWIGQFVGHKIERKKPSFFDDLKYLLIGPLWVFKH